MTGNYFKSYLKKINHKIIFFIFKRSIESDPKQATSYNGRGLVFDKLGDFEKAMKDFTSAI